MNTESQAKCEGGDGGGAYGTASGMSTFAEKSITAAGLNWPKQANGPHNDNAKDVAGDFISLSKDEKTVVAGHLAKSIEGGEVVEIRSVSSTSVIA